MPRYPRLTPLFSNPGAIVSLVAEVAEVVAPRRAVRILADDPNNRVLEAAVEASADFIVTGDRAFLNLDRYEGVEVVAPRVLDRLRPIP
ncbi:MAG: putative toxin-antitoxin system toxin component, PIN family [Actinomycetota bacterium]